MKMNMERKASAVILLAGTVWGIQNVFVKKLSTFGLDAMQISLIKMIVASCAFSLVILFTDRSAFRIRLKDIWMFIGTGIVSVTLYNYLGFYTAIRGGMAIAEVLVYTSPIFIMLISAVVFRERITAKKLLALVLTVAGCVLMAGVIGSGYRFESIVILTGVLSGFFFALYTIFSRFAMAKYRPITVTAWTFILGMAGSFPKGNIGGTIAAISSDPKVLLWGAGLGIISSALPYMLYTWSLQYVETGKASILSCMELVVGAVVGILLFSEPHDIAKIVGIAIIIAAIVLLNTGSSGKADAQED